jgi:glycosyltransferase involved in cell wall biosynthesis
VSQSDHLAGYIRKWAPSAAATVVIHPPVFGTPPFARLGRFDSGMVTMVNVCDLKGAPIFIELARAFPQVTFAAVPTWGTTDDDRRALAALHNVRILEPSENIEDILAVTRVLVVPSLWTENFPLLPGEALLRGIPVLASRVGGMPEAMMGVDTLLPVAQISEYSFHDGVPIATRVPEQDVGPWRDALERLLTDRDLYDARSREAHDEASRFVAKLSAEPYERLLAEPKLDAARVRP